MKIFSFLNCLLLLYFFTHVSVDHRRQFSFSEPHDHTHFIIDQHDSSHLHIFHDDEHHHADHENFHPQHTLNFHRKLPTIEGINHIVINSVDSFVFSAKETKHKILRHADLPPPGIVPIYVNNCSFLI